MGSAVICGVILLCVIAIRLALKKRQGLPLPPGPPADPLIGHLRVFPDPKVTPEAFYEWSLKYGDVFSLQVLGNNVIVVNSEKAANELFEKRSAIYSDRARMAYYDYIGWKDAVIFAPYGPFHAQQRKLYQEAFGKNAVSEYRGVQEQESHTLLRGLLDTPMDFNDHLQRFAGGVVTEIGYGHHINSFDDDFFSVGERFAKIAGIGATPSLLDLHPIFAHLPSWAPGSASINFINQTRPFMDSITYANHEKVREQMKTGTARPSFTAKHLEAMYEQKHDPEYESAVRLGAAMIFAAGFETTWHFLVIFVAAMLTHPDIQEKAREEIDRVVGRDRLPDFNDRDSLQYVRCIIDEVLRWNPINPIGFPHRVMEDDVYNGMSIPKGSIIIPNTRAFTWDENKFHNPKVFNPDRFLPKPQGAGEVLSANVFWGWGRRICAGRYLAEGSLFIAISRILAVFSISPAKDAQGRRTMPEIKFVTNTSRHPEPFTCDIQPRDEKARALIESCQD